MYLKKRCYSCWVWYSHSNNDLSNIKEVKQINIKNWTYYFDNDMINLKNFESNLLKIDKKSYKNIDIYNIGYITIKKINNYENIYGVNPLYFKC